MIAITIMALAFAAILTSESGSIGSTLRAKEYNIAAWLANNVMTEAEHLYEGKAFSEIPKEESKSFTDPYQKYKWKREVKELKFPDFNIPHNEQEGGVPEPIRILMQTITKFINSSLREIVVTVTWPRGSGEQKLVIATYLVDLTQEFNFGI